MVSTDTLSELGIEEKDGQFFYEIYPDYRDKLSPEQIAEILIADDPYFRLEEITENAYLPEIDHLYAQLNALEGFEEVQNNLIIQVPSDHFLDQQVDLDIAIDTGDGNRMFTANARDTLPPEASLNWLASTQGYSREKLQRALDTGNAEGSAFLKSVIQEWGELPSEVGMLTFFVRTTLREAIRIAEAKKEGKSIRVRADAHLGLNDPYNGAGSLLEIELEKSLDLPGSFVYSALPDEATGFRWGSVKSNYGMSGTYWRESVVPSEEET